MENGAFRRREQDGIVFAKKNANRVNTDHKFESSARSIVKITKNYETITEKKNRGLHSH
jgi:hypothetical protein